MCTNTFGIPMDQVKSLYITVCHGYTVEETKIFGFPGLLLYICLILDISFRTILCYYSGLYKVNKNQIERFLTKFKYNDELQRVPRIYLIHIRR